MTLLQARNIEVRAGAKCLIRDLSLDVTPGRFVAVIGPNGAGKSTLLGALAGDRPLAAGDVLLDGKPIAKWNKVALARRRAVLPQHSTVAFDFTGLQVTKLGLLVHRGRLSEKEMTARAEQSLAETEALQFADRPYTVLSGGERTRLAVARMLLRPSNTLLLDEPTNHLDLDSKDVLLEALEDYGGTLIFVSHDRYFVEKLATKIIEIGHGEAVVYPGTYTEFLWHKEHPSGELPSPKSPTPKTRPTPNTQCQTSNQ